jgi:hypothetical protein
MKSRASDRAAAPRSSGFPSKLTGRVRLIVALAAGVLWGTTKGFSADHGFPPEIRLFLEKYCWDCHGDGEKKGNVTLDVSASRESVLEDRELWWKVLKNVRAELMPPAKKPQPDREEKLRLENWIKHSVFNLDETNPDPGRVTVRRLNRTEYRNTIRDLLGVEFDTTKEFPPDDTGRGFDTIGDALTLPPMLLEKYFTAAKTIVTEAVPSTSSAPAEVVISGKSFGGTGGGTPQGAAPLNQGQGRVLSYYEKAAVTNRVETSKGGQYRILIDFTANERFVDNQFDYNKSQLAFKIDGREVHRKEYTREGSRAFHFEFDQDWNAGSHELVFEVQPLTPEEKRVRSLSFRIDSVTVRGPMDRPSWVRPKNYERVFTREVPANEAERRRYAREILGPFVRRAYRGPVDAGTLDRLIGLAESTYRQPEKSFEEGVEQAMVAVLASPRFLFREEGIEGADEKYPRIDEYALASRLSYFLWSSMPDDELLHLADERKLRAELSRQLSRMLASPKAEAFVRNFVGQWLAIRDAETVQIDARQVLNREAAPDPETEQKRLRFRKLKDKPETTLTPDEKTEIEDLRTKLFRSPQPPLRAELTGDLRKALRQETEKVFGYVFQQDRSLLELIDSDYTFLNATLARHYGLTNLNVGGDELRLVQLPPGSPRGGILTHGSILTVTSNPTRTSPVKRGLFILDNLLGTPPPPPPPNVPALEDGTKTKNEKPLTLRETLALHREKPLCSSCHNRMDPLGLALENFNALGMWRDQERSQPIDASGKLLSGEEFSNVRELKKALVKNHSTEFYRTVTEKLMTYALGRGLEYYDVATVDAIVGHLESSHGKPSELVRGIVESAAFQKSRKTKGVKEAGLKTGTGLRAASGP